MQNAWVSSRRTINPARRITLTSGLTLPKPEGERPLTGKSTKIFNGPD